MSKTRALSLLAACLLPLHAAATDFFDDAAAVPADKGVLIFKIERERSHFAAVSRRGVYQIVLKRTGSSDTVTISNPNRLKGLLLEPGEYYIYRLREIEGDIDATNLTGPSDAFVVVAGQASWAGTIKLSVGAGGTKMQVAQGEAELAELRDEFPRAVAAGKVQRVEPGKAPAVL